MTPQPEMTFEQAYSLLVNSRVSQDMLLQLTDIIRIQILDEERRRGSDLCHALQDLVENYLKDYPKFHDLIKVPYDSDTEDEWHFVLTHFCENLVKALIEYRITQCVESLRMCSHRGVRFT